MDEALLHVLVVHLSPGCYVAVWRVCTHGACEVAWEAGEDAVVCPCHNSHFDTDGSVLQGPATEALRSFEAVREGDTLYLYRPL